jgi:IS5 family transposase
MSFSDFEYAGKRKQARRERFLAEMDQVVPWSGLLNKRGLIYKAKRKIKYLKAQTRAKVELPFRVIKRQFGYVKVCFRGLMKNTDQLTTLFALSNLWMARKRLMGMGELRV